MLPAAGRRLEIHGDLCQKRGQITTTTATAAAVAAAALPLFLLVAITPFCGEEGPGESRLYLRREAAASPQPPPKARQALECRHPRT